MFREFVFIDIKQWKDSWKLSWMYFHILLALELNKCWRKKIKQTKKQKQKNQTNKEKNAYPIV
jgi:hypothetical protein